MRIRRQSLTVDFAAEMLELLLRNTPFNEGARVETRRGVALQKNQIAAERIGLRAKEVVEAYVVERGRRREARNMPAELGRFLVGASDHGHCVPAHVMANARFELVVAGERRLLCGGDRVDVRRRQAQRDVSAATLRGCDDRFDQLLRACRTLVREHAFNRVGPFAGFLRIGCEAGARAVLACCRLGYAGARHAQPLPAGPSIPLLMDQANLQPGALRFLA